jgi:transposase-like protein
LNNIVEQDHRAVKGMVRAMLGFKTHRCARILIAGIETMHMIRKGQLNCPKGRPRQRQPSSIRWLSEWRLLPLRLC